MQNKKPKEQKTKIFDFLAKLKVLRFYKVLQGAR